VSEKLCASCRFWMMPEKDTPESMGQCRWGPPTVMVVMSAPPPVSEMEKRIIQNAGARPAVQQAQPVFLSVWPSTKPGQGCGRWEQEDMKTVAPDAPA